MAKHLAQPDESLPSIRAGLTKSEIATMADQSVSGLLEQGDVFKMAEALASMEEFVRTVRRDERFVQFIRDELSKHHGMLITHSGAKIELCEAGVTYDYSANAEWRELEEQITELVMKKKSLEERLRGLAPGRMAVDPETGEVIEGAFRSSRSTYRITLSKQKPWNKK